MADKDDDLRRSGVLDEKNAVGQADAYRQSPLELFQEPDLPEQVYTPQEYGM